MVAPQKVGNYPPQDSAIPLLGIYPEDTTYHKNNDMVMFIASLFILARNWKQPTCSSNEESIKKI